MRALILRGGLGNQIFQFAAALAILEKDFSIWTSTGEPRKTQDEVDLAHFTLPINLSLDVGPNNRITKKLLSWSLVLGMKSEKSKKFRFLVAILNALVNIYFLILTRTQTKLVSGIGVGFFDLKKRNANSILNGYFQADFWANNINVNKVLHDLRLKSPSEEFLNWIELIKLEKPIIVHVRLGDYRNEDGIGILSPNYFQRALNNPVLEDISKNVWVFTDEPSSIDVRDYVPSMYRTMLFEDISLSPSETLELMRHGLAYVISNSTFSWWAAYLSYNRQCPRFMPTPWFKISKSPIGIKPREWIEVDEPF